MKTREELREFTESIDFTPLKTQINRAVNRAVGLYDEEDLDIKFVVRPENRRDEQNGSVSVDYESEDIRRFCGVFGTILKKATVTDFGSYSFIHPETGEPVYSTDVVIAYTHHDGGSNSMTLLRAWYFGKERGWEFKDAHGSITTFN